MCAAIKLQSLQSSGIFSLLCSNIIVCGFSCVASCVTVKKVKVINYLRKKGGEGEEGKKGKLNYRNLSLLAEF